MGRKSQSKNNGNCHSIQQNNWKKRQEIKEKYLSNRNVTLCLTMIVKNESRVMERCLNCLLPVLDFVCITDTGSTDNTVEIITNWCTEHNLPYKVHVDTWVNFAHNRSNSFTNAKKTFPEATYCLLVDADMKMEVMPNFCKQDLKDNYYTLEQYHGDFSYTNIRIISMHLNWVCKGVTHESWWADNSGNKSHYTGLRIDDIGDGGAKGDKFIRDKKLLSEALNRKDLAKDERSRYHFYLGQTLKDSGEYEESIKHYLWYINNPKYGYYEYVYLSHYHIGICYERMGKDKEAMEWYYKSYEFRNERLEGLYAYVLLRSKNHLLIDKELLELCIKVDKTGVPGVDCVFVENGTYIYRFKIEILYLVYYLTFTNKKYKQIGEIYMNLLNKLIEEYRVKNEMHMINRWDLEKIKYISEFYGCPSTQIEHPK
jgi:tetratricopeptide (TPR) repeat protein